MPPAPVSVNVLAATIFDVWVIAPPTAKATLLFAAFAQLLPATPAHTLFANVRLPLLIRTLISPPVVATLTRLLSITVGTLPIVSAPALVNANDPLDDPASIDCTWFGPASNVTKPCGASTIRSTART